MISNRIEPQALSTLCERVGVAFEVGLDPHRVFEREASNSKSNYGRRMRSVADHVQITTRNLRSGFERQILFDFELDVYHLR